MASWNRVGSNKIKLTSLLSKLPKGKYKGKRIGDLISQDPEYCKWLFSQSFVEVDKSVINTLNTFHYYAM